MVLSTNSFTFKCKEKTALISNHSKVKGLESERKKEETGPAISTLLLTSQRISKNWKRKTQTFNIKGLPWLSMTSDAGGSTCCTRCLTWPSSDTGRESKRPPLTRQQLASQKGEWTAGFHSEVWAMSGILIWASGFFRAEQRKRAEGLQACVLCDWAFK